MTTLWFQRKTGPAIGARRFIQGRVVRTFHSYVTTVWRPSKKRQRPVPASSPSASASITKGRSMFVIRVSKRTGYGITLRHSCLYSAPTPSPLPPSSLSTRLTPRHHAGHCSTA
jgi:hypothetical protein